jgi:hypothetical protein
MCAWASSTQVHTPIHSLVLSRKELIAAPLRLCCCASACSSKEQRSIAVARHNARPPPSCDARLADGPARRGARQPSPNRVPTASLPCRVVAEPRASYSTLWPSPASVRLLHRSDQLRLSPPDFPWPSPPEWRALD